jgi:hypothetical protein
MSQHKKAAEREALLAVCKKAGIPDEDIIDHPEHGLMVAARSVGKLRALAPPSYVSTQIGEWAAEAARSAIRRVK